MSQSTKSSSDGRKGTMENTLEQETEQSGKNLTPRQYQLDIVQKARRENIIACLPTGSGKTFVAILLMKELGHQIEGDFKDGAKRTIFLVPSVALVQQQHGEVEAHTNFKVGKYVGSDGVDGWSEEKWLLEFSTYQVMVMTVQIMVNILTCGFMHNKAHKGLGCVNLLILDECHHAAKGDPYVQVMKRMEDCQDDDQPRVLGLSASLVNQSDKSIEKFEARIQDLKKQLSANLTTARDMAEVTRFATKPAISLVTYSSEEPADNIVSVLQSLIGFINSHPFAPHFKVLKNGLISLKLIFVELGPWATHKAARTMGKDLRRACSSEKDSSGMYRLCLSRLRLIATMAKTSSYASPGGQRMVLHPKLRKLKEILHCHAESMKALSEPKKVLGIVFVDRRYMALALSAVLNQMGRVDQRFGSVVRCDFLTGHSDIDIMSREASMKVNAQNKVIRKFGEQTINLLVATRVAEEGLDIRKCNLVVRFDPLQEFRGYVQSRGRARDKPSSFIVMTPTEKENEVTARLGRFDVYEKHLTKCCQDEHHEFFESWEDEDDDDDDVLEQIEDLIDHICPPFYPDPANRELARADLTTSVQLVNMYVSKLCRDGTQLAAKVCFIESASEAFPEHECFVCQITLPPCSALPMTKIEGIAMPTRSLAKRAACLRAVKLLHDKKELDKHLRPVPPDDYFDEEDFSDDELEEVEQGGDKKRKLKTQCLYSVKVPECFKSPEDTSSRSSPAETPFHLYSLRVSANEPDLADKYTTVYGLLLPQPMAESTEFDLVHRHGRLHIRIVSEGPLYLPADKVQFISDFTRFLFLHGIDVPSKKGAVPDHLEFLSLLPSDLGRESPVWLAGVVMVSFSEPQNTSMCVDWAAMRYVQDYSDGFRQQWNPAVVDGLIMAATGRVVEKRWESLQDVHASERGKYEVLRINKGVSSTMPCDANMRLTHGQLDDNKGYPPLRHPQLPLLEVRRADTNWDFISNKANTERSKADQKKLAKSRLIAEHCKLHVLTFQQLHSGSLLPSLLTRLLHEQQAVELHTELCTSMALQVRRRLPHATFSIAKDPDKSSCTTTATASAPCTQFGTMVGDKDSHGLATAFPSRSQVFETLARTACRYELNLERLEMLGDSYLKLATSVYLFCHPKLAMASEGSLTDFRMRMISNATLYRASRKRGLVQFIFKECSQIRERFVPPLCRVSESPVKHASLASSPAAKRQAPFESATLRKLTENDLKIKHLADTVEALIGAFLLSGGNDAARHFMVWCGIPHRSISSKKARSRETPDRTPERQERYGVGQSRLETSSRTSSGMAAEAVHISPMQISPHSAVQLAPAWSTPHVGSHGRASPCSVLSRQFAATAVCDDRTPAGSSASGGCIPFSPDSRASSDPFNSPPDLDHHESINARFLQPTLPESPLDIFKKARGYEGSIFKDINAFRPELQHLENILKYQFRDASWLLEAITHPSYDQQDDCIFVRSYQQLEFLGDAILDYLVVRHVYDNCGTDLGPGDLALILHSVTCNSKLAEIAVDLELHKFLRLGSPALFRAMGTFIKDYRKRSGTSTGENSGDDNLKNFLHADGNEQGLEWPDIDEDSDEEDGALECTTSPEATSPEGEAEDDNDDDLKAEVPAPKALGDLVESLTAAVFVDVDMDLDKTWKILWTIMQPAIEDAVSRAKKGTLKSPVVRLHERFATKASFSSESVGRRIRGTYTVELGKDMTETFSAVADSKHAAKIDAAKKALKFFDVDAAELKDMMSEME